MTNVLLHLCDVIVLYFSPPAVPLSGNFFLESVSNLASKGFKKHKKATKSDIFASTIARLNMGLQPLS